MNIDKRGLLLLVLASSDRHFTPVQLQKTLFLIDERGSGLVGGKKFNFEPYDYGPFDQEVYRVAEQLQREGLIEIDNSHSTTPSRRYALTAIGRRRAQDVRDIASSRAVEYIRTVVTWVQSLSFADLVSAIYKEFPAMRSNSVFRG